jgi:hypothetical protein
MGGRRRSFSSGWNSTIFSPDRERYASFRRANPTSPPPAKGRRYDDYISEWNKNNPPKTVTTTVPTAAEPEAPKPPPIPEANLTGAVQLAPSGQLGQTQTNVSDTGNTTGAATPGATQQAPSLTATAPNPAMAATAQTTPQSQLTVGQLTPTSSVAGAQSATGTTATKPTASNAGDSTSQYNQTPSTPQTGPSTGVGAAGINPAAAMAAARRSNQNVTSASQYLMPSISGLRFGGY